MPQVVPSQQHQRPTATALKRPVNELLGSLIDSNSFSISTNDTNDDVNTQEEGDFQRNPSLQSLPLSLQLALQELNTTTTNSADTTASESNSKSTSPLVLFKNRFLSRFNNNNNTTIMSNNNNPTNDIPLVQAHLVESETTNNSYTATPTQYFQYNNETLEQNENPPPTAPAFTTITDDSPSAQAHSVSWKTRYGSDMGRIQAIEEKEKIKRVSANAKGYPYFESKRVEAADAIAKRRDREGFDVKIDKYFDESGLLSARKGNDDKKKGSGTNAGGRSSEGYQVAEYNTEEYNTTEYKTTEYKSVYD